MKSVAAAVIYTIIKGKVFRNITTILICVHRDTGYFQRSGVQNGDINERRRHQGKHSQQCNKPDHSAGSLSTPSSSSGHYLA